MRQSLANYTDFPYKYKMLLPTRPSIVIVHFTQRKQLPLHIRKSAQEWRKVGVAMELDWKCLDAKLYLIAH